MVFPFLETPRFPVNISEGSSGGPEWKTYISDGHSAVEQRHVGWSRSRARYDVSYGIRDKADMEVVRAFFNAMRGRATGFRFKDWSEYELDQEQIGVGDGVRTVFRITKTYTAGTISYVRRIFKPISGTLVVRVNNVVTPSGFTVDYTTGTITFSSAVTNSHSVKVSCEFDTPVRFDTDHLEAAHEGWLTESWGNIPLIEILMSD